MTRHFFIIVSFLVIILCSLTSSTSNVNDLLEASNAFHLVLKDTQNIHYDLSTKDIQTKKANIYIELEQTNKTEINPFNLFYTINHLLKEYRFTLKYGFNSPLDKANITVRLNIDNDYYEFYSELPIETIIDQTDSNLKKNDRIIYTSLEYKRKWNEIYSEKDIEIVNGFADKEIYHYMKYFFHVMTKGGHDFNPYIDVDLVINATMDKYGITKKQVAEIYQKYEYL